MRRLLLIISAGVIAIVVIAAAALYWFLSGDGIRTALEQQATAWLGQPVTIGAARAQFYPRLAIHLGDVRAGNPVQLALAEVDVSTDVRALLRRRIEDAEIVISRSRIQMPLSIALPESADSTPASASAGAASSGSIQLVSVRAISLRDVQIVSRRREIVVSADSALKGTELQLQRFTATSGATALNASGIVQLEPRVDARLRVTANQLDVDELIALGTAFVPDSPPERRSAPRPRSSQAPPRIAARVSSEKATAGRVGVRQFATDLEIDGENVSLSPLTFQLFGGRYQGSINARLGSTVAATVRARISDLDVAQLAAFGGVAETISGQLSGAATVTGQGNDVDAILRTARGTGTASIVKGSIRHLNLVRTIVLFFGRPAADAPGATDAFERMDATFALASQVFRADAFSMHSDDVDLVGNGTLMVATKALEGKADLSLSEALSAQAGTDLYRYTREGNRVVLPGSVGGTLDAPRLTIDIAAAVKRGLRNEVERRLKTILEGFGRQP